jgi:hypothetical protein
MSENTTLKEFYLRGEPLTKPLLTSLLYSISLGKNEKSAIDENDDEINDVCEKDTILLTNKRNPNLPVIRLAGLKRLEFSVEDNEQIIISDRIISMVESRNFFVEGEEGGSSGDLVVIVNKV